MRRLIVVSFAAVVATACTELEGTEPGECTDNLDNDGDGSYDCEDPDCMAAPDCQEDTKEDTGPQISSVQAACEAYLAAFLDCIATAYPDETEMLEELEASTEGTCDKYAGNHDPELYESLACYTMNIIEGDCSTPEGYAETMNGYATGCGGS